VCKTGKVHVTSSSVRVTIIAAGGVGGGGGGITYSEWRFVALFIQHVTRMRRIILPPMACPAVPYFCILSHKWDEFRGGRRELLNIKCVF
jgi:hypothetical protein